MAEKISRRTFIKNGAIALGSVAVLNTKGFGSAIAASGNNAKVFFTPDISADGLLKIFAEKEKYRCDTAALAQTYDPDSVAIKYEKLFTELMG